MILQLSNETFERTSKPVIVSRNGAAPERATLINEVWTEYYDEGKPTGKPAKFLGFGVVLESCKQVVYAQPEQISEVPK